MDLLFNLVAFLVALSILVGVHELGHYLVARASGVHVVRFAIGVGRPLVTVRNARGTEFSIGAFPIGGYVRMLDEREQSVPAELAARSFNRLSVWWRIAIALGGPIANFLLAIAAYWLVFVAGTFEYVPVTGEPKPGTPAAVAGLEPGRQIVAVDEQAVQTWEQINLALAARLGESGEIVLQTTSLSGGDARTTALPISSWLRGIDEPDFFESLGLMPGNRLPIMGDVNADSAAERAGLRRGDWVQAIDGQPVDTWQAWAEQVRASPGEALSLTVSRGGQPITLSLVPERIVPDDAAAESYGLAGVGLLVQRVQHGPLASISKGVERTIDTTVLTLSMLKKMVFGDVSLSNLSGPITIATVAGQSAEIGWHRFVGVLALLSVSLGVLNLLPIPMLDGGHVVFCLAEVVRGRALSERTQALGFQVGLVMVGGLMFLALYNDVARLF